jgi:teichuronic acid biosynthesis glycosyltransferase TuaC
VSTTSSGRRLRIAVVSSFYPSAVDPYHGLPVLYTLAEMTKLAEVRLICPLPVSLSSGKSVEGEMGVVSEAEAGLSPVYLPFRTFPLLGRPFNGWMFRSRARRFLAEIQTDLILTYWIYPDGFAAVGLAAERGIPVVLGARGSDLRRPDRLSLPLTRSALRRSDGLLVVSDDLGKIAIAHGARPERVRTVRNGVDTTRFGPRDKAEVRARLGIERHKQVVIFIGALIAAKGLTELLGAVRELAQRHPGLELLVVGEGKMRADVEGLGKDFPGMVRLVGSAGHDEIGLWIGASDLLCLPSYSEGCPNVVLEALACGRPVVGTTVGGIPEVLSPDCGALIEPRSTAEVVRGIEEVLSRKWDARRISEQGGRDWATVAAETYQFCEEVHQQFASSEKRRPEPA